MALILDKEYPAIFGDVIAKSRAGARIPVSLRPPEKSLNIFQAVEDPSAWRNSICDLALRELTGYGCAPRTRTADVY